MVTVGAWVEEGYGRRGWRGGGKSWMLKWRGNCLFLQMLLFGCLQVSMSIALYICILTRYASARAHTHTYTYTYTYAYTC